MIFTHDILFVSVNVSTAIPPHISYTIQGNNSRLNHRSSIYLPVEHLMQQPVRAATAKETTAACSCLSRSISKSIT
jgi:hypothetical protein